MRRTMSWSVLDKAFIDEDFEFSIISPFAAGHNPFCCDVVASSLSPLCCGQPLACMLPQEMRSFLRGGGETPPSSEPEDDASIASLLNYGLYWSGNTNHSQHTKENKGHPNYGQGSATKFVLLCDVTTNRGDDGKYQHKETLLFVRNKLMETATVFQSSLIYEIEYRVEKATTLV